MRHDGPDDVRPTGHLQIKGGPHGRVWYALWRDADGRHQKRLGPAHVRDSGRRTARGAVVWWAANGSKPDADHLTPAEADTALRELLDTAVREPTDPAQRAPPCLDAFRIDAPPDVHVATDSVCGPRRPSVPAPRINSRRRRRPRGGAAARVRREPAQSRRRVRGPVWVPWRLMPAAA